MKQSENEDYIETVEKRKETEGMLIPGPLEVNEMEEEGNMASLYR